MRYKWKPSKSQKREFAMNMQDSEFAASYYRRKEEKAEKKRNNSQFDYNTAGGYYIPTKAQHDFCVFNRPTGLTPEQIDACNFVATGYSCNEKVHHDYIHIVNELIRCNL